MDTALGAGENPTAVGDGDGALCPLCPWVDGLALKSGSPGWFARPLTLISFNVELRKLSKNADDDSDSNRSLGGRSGHEAGVEDCIPKALLSEVWTGARAGGKGGRAG